MSNSNSQDVLKDIYLRLKNINASLTNQPTMSLLPPIFNPNDPESYIYQEIDTLGNILALGSSGGTSISSSYATTAGSVTFNVFCPES